LSNTNRPPRILNPWLRNTNGPLGFTKEVGRR
jgi:hypothetical protein